MKVALIVSEIIILSGFLVFYSNLKSEDTAKSNSGSMIVAEAVPPDRGSPDTRGRRRRRVSSLPGDIITKEIQISGLRQV